MNSRHDPYLLPCWITFDQHMWSSAKGHASITREALWKQHISAHIHYKFLASLSEKKKVQSCGCLYSARHFSLFLVENIHETFCSYVLMVNSVFFFILFWYSSDRRLCQYDIISILPDAGRYWRARCLSIFPALLFVFPKPYHLY